MFTRTHRAPFIVVVILFSSKLCVVSFVLFCWYRTLDEVEKLAKSQIHPSTNKLIWLWNETKTQHTHHEYCYEFDSFDLCDYLNYCFAQILTACPTKLCEIWILGSALCARFLLHFHFLLFFLLLLSGSFNKWDFFLFTQKKWILYDFSDWINDKKIHL